MIKFLMTSLMCLSTLCLLTLAIATHVHAEESAKDTEPLASVHLPHIQRSIDRFKKGIFWQVWQQKEFKKYHDLFNEQILKAQDSKEGKLFFALQDSLASIDIELYSVDIENEQAKFSIIIYFEKAEAIVALEKLLLEKHGHEFQNLTEIPHGYLSGFSPKDASWIQILRSENHIFIGNSSSLKNSYSPVESDQDLRIHIDMVKYIEQIKKIYSLLNMPEIDMPYDGHASASMKITTKGFIDSYNYEASNMMGYTAPIDFDLLKRLPQGTLLTVAEGFNGTRCWEEIVMPMLQGFSQTNGQSPEEMIEEATTILQQYQIAATPKELVSSIQGTFALAITESFPWPAIHAFAPRSEAIDRVLKQSLKLFLGLDVSEENKSYIIPMPGQIPITVSIGHDANHWCISTDGMFINQWLSGKSNGWENNPAVQKALEACEGKRTDLFASSHTDKILSLIDGYTSMLGMTGMDQEGIVLVKQIITGLRERCDSGYILFHVEDNKMHGVASGLVTPISLYGNMIPIITSIAIPNLIKNRTVEQEAAVQAHLRSGVFVAQVSFQGGAYLDQNNDGIGEYGFFPEFSGKELPNSNTTLQLLGSEWNDINPINLGYNFAIYLPGSMDNAISDNQGRLDTPEAVKLRSQYWIAYAWPENEDHGYKMFAITQNGHLYETFYNGENPVWNSAMGGGNWDAEIIWTPSSLHNKRRSQNFNTPTSVKKSSASKILKASVFTAQVIAQAEGYSDQDEDGAGEYLFLEELSGGILIKDTKLDLIDETFQKTSHKINGYRLRIYLPNGKSSAIQHPSERNINNKEGAQLRERFWVAYAWPIDGSSNPMYAIDSHGKLYEAEYWGVEPQWNELYGGGNWGDPAIWKLSK